MKKYIFFLISFFLFGSLHPKDYESETIPIGPHGKPDLNGVWQVMNRANFNLEAHSASAAMHLIEGPTVSYTHLTLPTKRIV